LRREEKRKEGKKEEEKERRKREKGANECHFVKARVAW
jgi:hypothetical protein